MNSLEVIGKACIRVTGCRERSDQGLRVDALLGARARDSCDHFAIAEDIETLAAMVHAVEQLGKTASGPVAKNLCVMRFNY